MRIVLKGQERATKDKVIAEKQKEGWTLVNITEGFDTITTGTGGVSTDQSLILDFTKYGN